jgi:hypothetical protein
MLNVVKMEMHSGADRNAFGNLALDFCRAAKAVSGVNSANYFWVNPNLIGFIIDFQDGAWGPGATPDAAATRANFALGDISSMVTNEYWMSAGAGTHSYTIAQ